MGKETDANIVKADVVGEKKMIVLLASDSVSLISLGVLRVSFLKQSEGFLQGRERLMIGELCIGEETSSSSCSKVAATIRSSASGAGDFLLGFRQGDRSRTAAMKAYLCGISTAKRVHCSAPSLPPPSVFHTTKEDFLASDIFSYLFDS